MSPPQTTRGPSRAADPRASLLTPRGSALLGVLAAAFTFPRASPTLGIMTLLGKDIDDTHDLTLVIASSQTAACIVSPSPARVTDRRRSTVVLAPFGLYASGIGFIGNLGLDAGHTAAVAAVGALTMVCAILSKAVPLARQALAAPPVAEPSDPESNWPPMQGTSKHITGDSLLLDLRAWCTCTALLPEATRPPTRASAPERHGHAGLRRHHRAFGVSANGR